jgi:hypothetical protein
MKPAAVGRAASAFSAAFLSELCGKKVLNRRGGRGSQRAQRNRERTANTASWGLLLFVPLLNTLSHSPAEVCAPGALGPRS